MHKYTISYINEDADVCTVDFMAPSDDQALIYWRALYEQYFESQFLYHVLFIRCEETGYLNFDPPNVHDDLTDQRVEWTQKQLLKFRPTVTVRVDESPGKVHYIAGRVSGISGNFATISFKHGGINTTIEAAWETVARVLRTGKELIY